MNTSTTGPHDDTPPSRRRSLRRGGLAVVAGLLAVAASVSGTFAPVSADQAAAESARSSPALRLPAPTGTHPVGMTSVYLKDASRPDPWVPEMTARELMVSLWYPAKTSHGQRAPYLTPAESELLLTDAGISGVPLDALSTVGTNAVRDAAPAGRRHGLPLVVLSPGFTKPRATLTALAEDLASHGYLVAGIEHTYESAGTSFPDGRVATCVACEGDHDEAFWAKLGAGRAADVSFVLDELTGAHPVWKGARLIDPSRIGMAGHSAGGASTVAVMVTDSRVRAGINIDGTATSPVPEGGLSRPYLFLGTQARHTPSQDPTWVRAWEHLTGWKRWLVVTGAEHASFTDIGLFADQVGLDIGAELPAARVTQLTRAYVRAFVDLHLRDTPQPLLAGPSPRNPEVQFCSVATLSCR